MTEIILKHDYVLLNPITEEVSSGGIILTVDTQKRQLVGEVQEIGTDIEDEDLKIGSKVIYDRLNSSEIEIKHKKYIICQYDDIIAIV